MPAPSDPVDIPVPHVCPLCGGPNECGRVAGLEECCARPHAFRPRCSRKFRRGARPRCICHAHVTRALSSTSEP
jgi:hypothetical protein